MGNLAQRDPIPTKDSIQKLRVEISILEEQIGIIGSEISSFENTIRMKLHLLISRLVSLNEKMKEKQKLKKAKRLEQKKKGKNYKEPVTGFPAKSVLKSIHLDNEIEKHELKRLYKETVVLVHPDKIGMDGEEDAVKTATDLTAQLNGIYKSGDLEQLLSFYNHNILGNTNEILDKSKMIKVDSKIRTKALVTKKENLSKKLELLKDNYLYHVIKTYENPLVFIEELEAQFQEKIGKLEKRTRKI